MPVCMISASRDKNTQPFSRFNRLLATHTHTHPTVLRPFFRDHPGEPVPEENFWTLWCKGRLTEADTLTIRLGVIPSRRTSAHLHHHPMFFYGLDALPAAQPTVSKHWRQKLTTSQQSLNGVEGKCWEYQSSDFTEQVDRCTSSCHAKQCQRNATFHDEKQMFHR